MGSHTAASTPNPGGGLWDPWNKLRRWAGARGEAHLAVQFLHGHQIQGLEGVAGGRDEVEADMDPRVMVVEERAADLQLFLQIIFKLRIDVVDDGPVTTDSSVT